MRSELKKLNIVLVTPRLDLGGGQRYVSELAAHWSKLNYKVTIIVLRSYPIFYTIPQEVKIISLEYLHDIGGKNLTKFNSGLVTLFRLRKEIIRVSPDFVLSILSSTNILTLLATRFLKTPIFLNDIMSPFRNRSKLERVFRKLLYKRADGIIALTSKAREFIMSETQSKNVVVIPNPVNYCKIDKPISREKLIINVGRLHGSKGQSYFLDLCHSLKNTDWNFVILGEGPLRKSLEKKIKDLGIEDKVQMPGSVTNVDEWLAKASIFALTSVTEGLPIALIEAMSAGLACVSFDCETGPREIIENDFNGFLVPVGNVEWMTLKISELINDEKLRNKFSANAKKNRDKFSIERVSEDILKFCSVQKTSANLRR